MIACNCGSGHYREALLDAQGIFVANLTKSWVFIVLLLLPSNEPGSCHHQVGCGPTTPTPLGGGRFGFQRSKSMGKFLTR